MNNKIIYPKIYTIISAVISLFYTAVLIFFCKDYVLEHISVLKYCFIPLLFSAIIWFISVYANQKLPKLTKIITNILNITVLVLHSIFMSILTLIIIAFSGENDPLYDKIEDYQKALDSYKYSAVSFFPEKIPENAKNISILRTSGGFHGDSTFYIKFDIDKEYIQNEMNKYKNQGKAVIINEFSQLAQNKNYDETRAAVILDSVIKEENEGYKVIILNSEGDCFKGIATKNNTILYVLALD